MTDWRGRTPDCLPFCQGGLHEEGCPVLNDELDPVLAPLLELVERGRRAQEEVDRMVAEYYDTHDAITGKPIERES